MRINNNSPNNSYVGVKHLAFYLGFGTFFAHELDSMLNHEWRVIQMKQGADGRTTRCDRGAPMSVEAFGPNKKKGS